MAHISFERVNKCFLVHDLEFHNVHKLYWEDLNLNCVRVLQREILL